MKLVFTLTAGRTGTFFLAKLLARNGPRAEVHHERLGFEAFGVDTPDVSDLMLFNSRGNVQKVRRFWDSKFSRILGSGAGMYVETSHVLMKAGLVENAVRLCRGHELHLIRLRRSLVPTLLSYERRGDFVNKGSQWLWYLDETYPRTFISSDRFSAFGLHGLRLWYLMEIEYRAAYYRERYQGSPGVHFHQADIEQLNDPVQARALLMGIDRGQTPGELIIPDPVNVSNHGQQPDLQTIQTLERLVAGTRNMDPSATARDYVRGRIDPFAPEELQSEPGLNHSGPVPGRQ
jgi:hypothetical protein